MQTASKLKTLCCLLAAGLPAGTVSAEDPSQSKLEDATIDKIKWGEHWAGPKLKGAKSLEGKVVLLKIWGG